MKKSKLFILSGLAMLTMAFAMSCSNPAGGDTTPAPTPIVDSRKPVPEKILNAIPTGTETVKFGVWPQTVKGEEITIDETVVYKANEWSCYKGSDEAYYVKEGNSYFKLEPIEWSVINSSENEKVLFAKTILDSCCFNKIGYKRIDGKVQVDPNNKRTIDGTEIYPNNYQYSQVRAYLNGLDGTSYKNDNFTRKGFLQKAFSESAIKLIVDKEVQTGIKDKIFLLDDDNASKLETRKKEACGYANSKKVWTSYWLRTALTSFSGWLNAAYVHDNGNVDHRMLDLEAKQFGVVPALILNGKIEPGIETTLVNNEYKDSEENGASTYKFNEDKTLTMTLTGERGSFKYTYTLDEAKKTITLTSDAGYIKGEAAGKVSIVYTYEAEAPYSTIKLNMDTAKSGEGAADGKYGAVTNTLTKVEPQD